MKRVFCFSLGTVILFLSCKAIKMEDVTLIGCAMPTNGLAGVLSPDNSTIYYIDNLLYWDQEFNFKQVEVQGRLKAQKINKKRTIFLILNATWKLTSQNQDTTTCIDNIIWYRDNILFPDDGSRL